MLEGGEELKTNGKLPICIHLPWPASHNEHTCSEKLITPVLQSSDYFL